MRFCRNPLKGRLVYLLHALASDRKNVSINMLSGVSLKQARLTVY